jgi:hypothetical protein
MQTKLSSNGQLFCCAASSTVPRARNNGWTAASSPRVKPFEPAHATRTAPCEPPQQSRGTGVGRVQRDWRPHDLCLTISKLLSCFPLLQMRREVAAAAAAAVEAAVAPLTLVPANLLPNLLPSPLQNPLSCLISAAAAAAAVAAAAAATSLSVPMRKSETVALYWSRPVDQ